MKTASTVIRTVGQIMTGDLRTINADDALRDARELMLAMSIHALPVLDEFGDLVGIVSSHDLVDDELSFEEGATIGDVMAYPVVTIDLKASISEAAETMRSEQIHHLVVLDGTVPVGILSSFDLLRLIG